MKLSAPNFCKNHFTIIELLVVIAVIVILISLLMPAIGKAKDTGRRISCAGNMRQIGIAALQYAGENNEWLPAGSNSQLASSWTGALANDFPPGPPWSGWGGYENLVYGNKTLKCPSNQYPVYTTVCYGPATGFSGSNATKAAGGFISSSGGRCECTRFNQVLCFSQTPYFLETYKQSIVLYTNDTDGYENSIYYDLHQCGSNTLFTDGHVSRLNYTSLAASRSNWVLYFGISSVKPDWK
jgi:prepilin-type processing-associated H-X9-DG protein